MGQWPGSERSRDVFEHFGSAPSMNGVHDLGGPEGSGALENEAGEPTFHETVEGRAFALDLRGVSVRRLSA
ncbi:MAG: hypothetical protein CL931_08010 [Deltaproteobacteria bacterium]|nr:hypothetical protein [Deltaproteobacteria bacterium]